MRKIRQIIIHCSATPIGRDIGAKEIERWHRHLGWKTIGYHYVIRLDGSLEKGRPEWQIGAHCVGYNRQSIGICYIGGLNASGVPNDTRTAEQTATMIQLIRSLLQRYPSATVCGHNNLSTKACPGFDVIRWWNGVTNPPPLSSTAIALTPMR